MTLTTVRDKGQKLPHPTGKLLGMVDTREQLDAVVAALQKARFEQVSAIQGEEGVNLLERVNTFFFSDMEERVLNRHIAELQAGHIVIAIETPSEKSEEAARIATENGARRLVYFGALTVTWLTP